MLATCHVLVMKSFCAAVMALVALLGSAVSTLAQQPNAFAAGIADRNGYERWIQGLTGDYLAGATYWTAHRSIPKEAHCPSGGNLQQGCVAALQRLAVPDMRRKSDPDYRQGWNSVQTGGGMPDGGEAPGTFLDPSTLTRTETILVQDALIWAGSYHGLKNGAWGPATVDAVKGWHQANYLPQAASFRPAEMTALLSHASGAKAALGWTVRVDAATGSTVGFPARLVSATVIDGGTSYTGSGDIGLTVRHRPASVDAIEAELDRKASGPEIQRVTYRLDKPDRQVLAFDTTDQFNGYIRWDRVGTEWRGFYAKVRQDMPEFANVIGAMSADFDAFGTPPPAVDARSAPQLFALNGKDDTAPSAQPGVTMPVAGTGSVPMTSAEPGSAALRSPEVQRPTFVSNSVDDIRPLPQQRASTPTPDTNFGSGTLLFGGVVAAGVLILAVLRLQAPLLVMLAASVAVAFAYPLLNEQTSSECHALEERGVALVTAGSQLQSNPLTVALAGAFANEFLNGSVATALVKDRFPAIPPLAACTAVYWQTFFDPSIARALSDAAEAR